MLLKDSRICPSHFFDRSTRLQDIRILISSKLCLQIKKFSVSRITGVMRVSRRKRDILPRSGNCFMSIKIIWICAFPRKASDCIFLRYHLNYRYWDRVSMELQVFAHLMKCCNYELRSENFYNCKFTK